MAGVLPAAGRHYANAERDAEAAERYYRAARSLNAQGRNADALEVIRDAAESLDPAWLGRIEALRSRIEEVAREQERSVGARNPST